MLLAVPPAEEPYRASGLVQWPIAAQGVQRTMSATGQSRLRTLSKGSFLAQGCRLAAVHKVVSYRGKDVPLEQPAFGPP